MSTPGFTAKDSLYRSSRHYYTSAPFAGAAGATLQGSFSFSLGGPGPARLRLPLSGLRSRCSDCYLDITGSCVRDCLVCSSPPRPRQPPDCNDITIDCRDDACCPSGQQPCPGSDGHGTPRFCCPPGTDCCD